VARFLFLALLPPPVHGISVISSLVLSVLRGEDGRYQPEIHDIGQSNDLTDMGARRLMKAARLLLVCVRLTLSRLWRGKAAFAYASLSPFGVARFRDAIIIAVARRVSDRCLVHVHAQGLATIMAGTTATDRLLRWCIKGAEILAITEATRATALSVPGHFRKVWHLPNAIEDPGVTPHGRPAGPLRLTMVTNMAMDKGIVEFIEALVLLKQRGVGFQAALVGAPSAGLSLATVAGLIRAAGLDGVLALPGPLYDQDKHAILHDSDIFAYPSRHDLAPLVVIEALAAGAVPVACDTGGIREMMGPDLAENVLSTDGGTAAIAERLATRIGELAADRAHLAGLSAISRQRYEQGFTTARFAADFRAILAGPTA